MNSYRKSLALIALLVALVALPGCRSKTSKKPTTIPPPVTDTAPDVTMTPPSNNDTPVEPRDFVQDRPAVNEEELPTDLESLNRMAQERGLIRDAFFDYDATTLSTDAQDALTTSAAWLKSHPMYNLLVEGHCDDRGTSQYNLALGDRRANTAKDYLVTLGVDSSRVRTVSYGEERPFETGSNEAAYAKNRRAHLVITGR
jgi:peptidoglycan-associated lipoprotein